MVDALKEQYGVEVEWSVRFEGMTGVNGDDEDEYAKANGGSDKCVVKLRHRVDYDMHNIHISTKTDDQQQAEEEEKDEKFGTAVFYWICGCDGARSPVQQALNLPFEGGTYAAPFYVANVDIAGASPHATTAACFCHSSVFLSPFRCVISPSTELDITHLQRHRHSPRTASTCSAPCRPKR